jgi:hypothetical protein
LYLAVYAELGLLLATTAATATGNSLLGTLAGARIRTGALAVDGQVAAVAHTAVTPDFDQALDIELLLTAKIAFNRKVFIDVITQRSHFSFGEVFNARVGIHLRSSQNLLGASQTNSKQVGQANFNPLIAREVNTFNSCHIFLPLSLLMLRIFADHIQSACALYNFAFRTTLANGW